MTRLPHQPWHKNSLSILIAGLIPISALVMFDRLDLATYTLSGSLVAVFTHAVPYRRRAGLHLRLVAAWTAGVAVSLTVAAATTSVVVHIVAAALLAAIVKVACEASAVGPPGPILPIFVYAGILFAPQEWDQVLGHLGLAVAGALIGWLVVMAPGAFRRFGPQRRAVATALFAAADHAGATNGRTRDALISALAAAWRCVTDSGVIDARGRSTLAALEDHLRIAELVLVDPGAVSAEQLRSAASAIKGSNRSVPPPAIELPSAGGRRAAFDRPEKPRTFAARHPVLAAFRPGSPATPYFLRLLVACLAAAGLSHLLGVGRPYWAIVTVAAIIQPNLSLTWHRAPARAIGAVLGVLTFFALAPLAHRDPLYAVALVLLLNAAVEFVLPRNYLLGQGLVTPMALLITEFAQIQPPTELVVERLLDTLLGVTIGLLAAFAIRNPHLHHRVTTQTAALQAAAAHAEAVAADPDPAPDRMAQARRRIYDAYASLLTAAQQAAGEWWSHRHDEEAAAVAGERAHQALLALRKTASP